MSPSDFLPKFAAQLIERVHARARGLPADDILAVRAESLGDVAAHNVTTSAVPATVS